jgi:hypothetical protein
VLLRYKACRAKLNQFGRGGVIKVYSVVIITNHMFVCLVVYLYIIHVTSVTLEKHLAVRVKIKGFIVKVLPEVRKDKNKVGLYGKRYVVLFIFLSN